MRRLAIFTLCLLALAACASADTFTFTYTGTHAVTNFVQPPDPAALPCGVAGSAPTSGLPCTGASGTLEATYLSGNQWQVNSGSGTYTNQAGATLGITIHPGSGNGPYFIWDNIAQPNFNPLLTNNGLLFDVSGGQQLNIYGWNTGDLYFAATAPPTYQGDAGGFSLTHVPDGGMTLMLLGAALSGIEILRRKARA